MSGEEKIIWCERQLESNTTKIEALSSRVTTLETYFKAVIALAAILGISGGVIYTELSSVRTQVHQSETDVERLKKDAEAVKTQVDQLEKSAQALEADIERTKKAAIEAIMGTGETQKQAVIKLASSTVDGLVKGLLKGSIKNLRVLNCGQKTCDCPRDWEKALITGGNGDLNRGAKGDYIYICVQYHSG